MPERVLIISDTHGFLDERIAEVSKTCDYVIHAGDVGSRLVFEALGQKNVAVLIGGNNDVLEKWDDDERDFLDTLPQTASLSLPGGEIQVVHGHRHGAPKNRHRLLRLAFPDTRMIVYGHSHHLCIDQTERPWVVNPGAAGRNRTFGGPSYLMLQATTRQWTVVAYRLEKQKK